MNRKARFAIAAALLVSAVAYLMYTGVSQTSMYYFTIGEFLGKKDSMTNEGVRVAGRVALGSVSKNMTPNGEELNFRIGDFKSDDSADQPTVPVHFVGVVPDMFKAAGGSDVIIEGKYRDGTLHAQTVMTSCPSKYEAKAGIETASK